MSDSSSTFQKGSCSLPKITVGELYDSVQGDLYKVIINAEFGGQPMVVLKQSSHEDGIIIPRLHFDTIFTKHNPFKKGTS